MCYTNTQPEVEFESTVNNNILKVLTQLLLLIFLEKIHSKLNPLKFTTWTIKSILKLFCFCGNNHTCIFTCLQATKYKSESILAIGNITQSWTYWDLINKIWPQNRKIVKPHKVWKGNVVEKRQLLNLISKYCKKILEKIKFSTILADPGLQLASVTCRYHVIYEQRERVFHRDIQTRENNVWKQEHESIHTLFSSEFGYPGETRARVVYMASQMIET
jgi:hypothetical protein